jgi:hypothetical protein
MLKHLEQNIRHSVKSTDIKAGISGQREEAKKIKANNESKFNELRKAVGDGNSVLNEFHPLNKAINLLAETIIRRADEDKIAESTINQSDRQEIERTLQCNFTRDIEYTNDPVQDVNRILELMRTAENTFEEKYRQKVASKLGNAVPRPGT